MEWSEEEQEALRLCQQHGGGWPQIAALSVVLAAARGGTLTADAIRTWSDVHPESQQVVQHIFAQGARIAVLEAAERATFRDGRDEGYTEGVESIRRRSLEAGNLERLIAEHGLPTAMRWVVEGKEPEQSTAPHGDYGGELREEHEEIQHYPRSPPCRHPERAKDRGEAFNGDADVCEHRVDRRDTCGDCEYERGEKNGAEAMRVACWEAVQGVLERFGWGSGSECERTFKAAIEGATP